jgi:hypothetical protein
MKPTGSGRGRESKLIEQADKIAAIGRLMLGEVQSWREYLKPSTTDYINLPRRQLKTGKYDVQKRLNRNVSSFCKNNFSSIQKESLLRLYEDVKAKRGLELPLVEFENKYGKVNQNVLKGNPHHLTVVISLWGLQFLFPEDLLTKDIVFSLNLLREAIVSLKSYNDRTHSNLLSNHETIRNHITKKEFSQRAIVLSCFNLIEAYLNGIAWDYCQTNNIEWLSKRKRDIIQDTYSVSTRDKLLKYPTILCGFECISPNEIDDFLDLVKPFRDSLVHPSPFSAPEKFGGYNKLRKIYELNENVAVVTVAYMYKIIKEIHSAIHKKDCYPKWIAPIKRFLEDEKISANKSFDADSLKLVG